MFNFFIQALEVKREIECPEVFVDDPHSGNSCEHVDMSIMHVGVAEFL